MELYSLRIEGFRRHIDTTVNFSDATFLIGENNIGKSTILHALNILLNDIKKIPTEDFCHKLSDDGKINEIICDKVVLTAEFRNISKEALTWTGFKGRVLRYDVPANIDETGYRIMFRKTFSSNTNYIVEMREYNREVKQVFNDCDTINSYLEAGLLLDKIEEKLPDITDFEKRLNQGQKKSIAEIEELYDFDDEAESWFTNPGGIPGNVLSKLPKFLLIPAQDKASELSSTSGALYDTLNELFKDVRDSSENFRKAQEYLNLLAKELDPNDENSEFGIMMEELNLVLGNVFPDIGIRAETILSEADKNIKPGFKISMQSNVVTPVNLQGTGVVRSAVFALLRYRTIRENRKLSTSEYIRPLIIGFEEPEIYLHPNAANQMKNTIYELASYEFNQIICTTHSPYMIDLSQKPDQILNNLVIDKELLEYRGTSMEIEKINCNPFNTSLAFKELQGKDKDYVKMLLKIDDYISRVFFTRKVLIVEGDTEDIVFRETISRMPLQVKNDILHNWQIIKARGKGAIISLVNYLNASGISPYVLHDRDINTPGAAVFNEPISNVCSPEKRFMLEECIEDILGYPSPTYDKPSKAYSHILENWGEEWSSIPERWRSIVESIFDSSFQLQKNESIDDLSTELEVQTSM
jgi:putative ATP-dependent endonuclease of the OLD family